MKKPKPLPTLTQEQAERFAAKVGDGPGSCRDFVGSPKARQPRTCINGQAYLASRIAFLLAYGFDPGERAVCHTCDRPRCCAPEHLFAGTQAENLADMTRKKRRAIGERHGMVKLSTEDISEIRESDETGVALAGRFGVHPMTISRIRRRLRWADAEPTIAA